MSAASNIRPHKAPHGSHQGMSGGGFTILLLAALFAAPATAATLQEGRFVRDGRACASEAQADELTSNGHSVSPSGVRCRVVSRTSSGSYYPIFNQVCTSSSADDETVDLHVSDAEHIALQKAGQTRIAYRYCPARR